jgi:hypothetical protein
VSFPTLDEIAQATHPRGWKAWRAVEAQHVVSTLRLTANDPSRQDLLERILEESKPPLPPATQGLHYLLATPFRYPPSQHGSRFRAWPDLGVLYAAATRQTACAELGYWRWRFVRDSSGLKGISAAAQTLFQLGASGQGIELTQAPLQAWEAQWIHASDYAATQQLARQARQLRVQWIGYQSVRDPAQGLCYALLDPQALKPKKPLAQENWYLTITSQGAIWQRQGQRFVFDYQPK